MTVSKVLILISEYIGTPLANGICMRNIVRSLKNNGNEVYVLCYKTDNGITEPNTFTILAPDNNSSTSIRLKKLSNLKKMILLSLRPDINKKLVQDFECKALEICKKYNIDTLVATYNPIETVVALCNIKKQLNEIKAIIYELDSYGDGIGVTAYRIWKNAFNKLCKKNYSIVDRVIIMQSHSDYWNKSFGVRYGTKLKVADIPMLIERNQTKYHNHGTFVSMIYTGNISKRYRSPSYLLSVLLTLKDFMDFRFTFYSRGDCESELNEVVSLTDNIFSKGYLPKDELDEIILRSDVLVSIGNSVSNSLPSKVIDYISYGKPIIHFSSQKNDVCIRYFKNYPLALVIDETMPTESACHQIRRFINEYKGKSVEYNVIKKMFYKNDPQYSAKLIMEDDEI